MADLKIKLGVQLADSSVIRSDLQKELDKLRDLKVGVKVDVNTEELKQLSNVTKNLSKNEVKIFSNGDLQNIQTINKNLAETQKTITKLSADGSIKTSTSEIIDYAKAQKTIYSELSKLQGEEYSIKKQMVSADENKKKILNDQLGIVKNQQQTLQQMANQYNVRDKVKDQELLISAGKKQLEVDKASYEYNKKIQVERQKIASSSAKLSDQEIRVIEQAEQKKSQIVSRSELEQLQAVRKAQEERVKIVQKSVNEQTAVYKAVNDAKGKIDNMKGLDPKMAEEYKQRLDGINNVSLEKARQEIRKVNDELKNKMDSLKESAQRWQDLGNVASSMGDAILKATVPMAGLELGALNLFKNFEYGMAQVQATAGANTEELQQLTNLARDMGKTTMFSASQSAEALKYMAQAGWKTEDMLQGLSGVMYASIASGENFAMVSDIITDSLTAFGYSAGDAGRFADILAQAAADTNTSIGLLGNSFQYVAPVAGALKYNLEDTAVALGLMAKALVGY